MRAFACPRCLSLIFFTNTRCLTCSAELAYQPTSSEFVDLDLATPHAQACANRSMIGCNWTAADDLCSCCALTRTRPADDDPAGITAWTAVEEAKRQLVFQLLEVGLPITPRTEHGAGLAFDLLSSSNAPVTTGHADGVITIDLAEGDDPHREAVRVGLAEPYRTVLGHLRHETGHYYWPSLVGDTSTLPRFRLLFGNEESDYAAALETHYATPDDNRWTTRMVSHYAAAHPWEDWAETFAHYLHIRDTSQTAAAWGMRVTGPDLALNVASNAQLAAEPTEHIDEFDELIRSWLPLSYALNAINRSMGNHALYPFILPEPVLHKLRFVHERITQTDIAG